MRVSSKKPAFISKFELDILINIIADIACFEANKYHSVIQNEFPTDLY